MWTFRSGGDTIDIKTVKYPIIYHTFYKEGSYSVELALLLTDGSISRSEPKEITVLSPTSTVCIVGPPPDVVVLPEDNPYLVNARSEGGDIIEVVRNGSAMVVAPGTVAPNEISLPPGVEWLRLRFKYQFISFPFNEVRQGKVFAASWVSVVFTKGGNTLASKSLDVLRNGELPPLEALGKLSDFISQPIQIPEDAENVHVLAVTSVLAPYVIPETPVGVRFSHFRTESVQKPKDCVKLTVGERKQIDGKVFVEKQMFSLYDRVTFEFNNACGETIALPNDAPWVIRDGGGRLIYIPTRQPGRVEVPVKTSRYWDVEPGSFVVPTNACGALYQVELETEDGSLYIAPFGIVWRTWGC
jgi:hypothetical protein